MSPSGVEPVRRLVLDTSGYSQMRAGQADVLELVARAESVLLPVTVIGELEGAFALGKRARENRVALTAFLAEPFVSVLPTTLDVAGRYGQIYAAQRRAGAAVPVNDMWIAAATLDCGGRLVTFDRDFERIAGLDCTVLRA